MGRPCEDLVGQQFGYSIVLERAADYYTPKKHKLHVRWLCKCTYHDCGREFIVYKDQLKSGQTRACPECAKKLMALSKTKRNEYEFTPDICIGTTSKGEQFIVDIEDYDLIKDYTWYYDCEGYVRGINSDRKDVLIHRLVTHCPDNMEVDHINGTESLCDNRKENLRICAHIENSRNKKKRKDSKNKYKGVYKRGNRYIATIGFHNKRIHIGSFINEEDAKEAYNQKAKELFGEFACLN